MASIRKNILSASTASVFNNLSFAIFVLILAKQYSVNELSFFYLSLNLYYLAAQFANLGMGNLIIREYHVRQNKLEFVSNLTLLEVITSVLSYLFLCIVIWLLGYPSKVMFYFLIIGLMIILDSFNYVFVNIFISAREQHYSALAISSEAALKLLLGVYILVHTHTIDLSVIVVIVVFFRLLNISLHFLFYLSFEKNFNPINLFSLKGVSWKRIRSLLYEGKIFFIITIIVATYNRLPVILLPKLSNLQDVAFYEMASKPYIIIALLPNILISTFYHSILKHIGKYDALSSKVKEFEKLFIPFSNILIIISLFGLPLVYNFIFKNKFDQSIEIFQILVLSSTMLGIIASNANILFSHGLEKLDMYFNIFLLLFIFIMIFLLVPNFGALGIAITLFIARSIFLLIQHHLVLKKFIPELEKKFYFFDILVFPLVLFILILLGNGKFYQLYFYSFITLYLFSVAYRFKLSFISIRTIMLNKNDGIL